MKKIITFILLFAVCLLSRGQNKGDFYGRFVNKENSIHLVLDLYEESIETPGFEFLGKSNGYIYGNLYSTWFVTSCKVLDKTHATIRVSNDQGADAVTIKLSFIDKKTLRYEVDGSNDIKKVIGRKLVKVPSTMDFSWE